MKSTDRKQKFLLISEYTLTNILAFDFIHGKGRHQ